MWIVPARTFQNVSRLGMIGTCPVSYHLDIQALRLRAPMKGELLMYQPSSFHRSGLGFWVLNCFACLGGWVRHVYNVLQRSSFLPSKPHWSWGNWPCLEKGVKGNTTTKRKHYPHHNIHTTQKNSSIHHLTISIEIYSTHMHILYGSCGGVSVQYLMCEAWHSGPNVRCHSVAAFSPFFTTWGNGNPPKETYDVGNKDFCVFAYLV